MNKLVAFISLFALLGCVTFSSTLDNTDSFYNRAAVTIMFIISCASFLLFFVFI